MLLVEADPTGGSGILAGFLKGTTPYDVGLLELALSPLGVADALRDLVRPLSPSVSLVPGTRTHAQAPALRDVWEPLTGALAELEANGQDVIVDAGRLGLTGAPQPLLEVADLTLLMTRATLPSISAARSWAEAVRQPATGWSHPGLLLVGEGQPYRDTEVSKVLGIPVVADLPEDPEGAAVYHRGAAPPRHFETGRYVRGLQAAAQSIQAQVARGRFALVEESAR
ncbi:MAG: MinD/ParA family ATP-binding protein [Solirubrobacteraceae bacterium]